ncbi:hypothetical protein N0V94_003489 [Neodidymelliopsis sp. IMI 364377]|nr:hypothetical protein N0V94_003489 [Neodidymelliopsis sp. IMI 364377]
MSIVIVPGSGGIRLGDVPPERQLWLAWLICSLLAITEFLWLALLAYLYYSTYFVARRFNARSAEEEEQMQVVDPDSPERRECTKCVIFKADRTYYHRKIYCLIIRSWVLSPDDPYRHSNLPASVIASLGVFIIFSGGINIAFWYSIGFGNSLSVEKEAETRWFRVKDGFFEWSTADYHDSPYYLEMKRNLYYVMGPGWSWLFFWTLSPMKDVPFEEIFEMRDVSATTLSLPASGPESSSITTGYEASTGTSSTRHRFGTDSSLPLTSSSADDAFPALTTSGHVRPNTE